MAAKRRAQRPVSDANTLVQGNRDYIKALRKGCSEALRTGYATVMSHDEDDRDVVTTILCSRRFGRTVGFQPPTGSQAD